MLVLLPGTTGTTQGLQCFRLRSGRKFGPRYVLSETSGVMYALLQRPTVHVLCLVQSPHTDVLIGCPGGKLCVCVLFGQVPGTGTRDCNYEVSDLRHHDGVGILTMTVSSDK
jgi:hypothetical protein